MPHLKSSVPLQEILFFLNGPNQKLVVELV